MLDRLPHLGHLLTAAVDPSLAALDDVDAYLAVSGDMDASPPDSLGGLDAAALGTHAMRLAVAQRQRELAESIGAIVKELRAQVDTLRAEIATPVAPLTTSAVFAYWANEARTMDGLRERIIFAPAVEVTLTSDFVRDNRRFLTDLLIVLVRECERARADILREDGMPDAEIPRHARITSSPSWRALLEIPALPMTEADALTWVAIGCVLGAWEATPGLAELSMRTDVDLDEVPFLEPTGILLGVVAPEPAPLAASPSIASAAPVVAPLVAPLATPLVAPLVAAPAPDASLGTEFDAALAVAVVGGACA